MGARHKPYKKGSGCPTTRGFFKHPTTTPARAWVLKMAGRGAVAAALTVPFVVVVSAAPAWLIVCAMIAGPILGLEFWRWMNKICPIDGDDGFA